MCGHGVCACFGHHFVDFFCELHVYTLLHSSILVFDIILYLCMQPAIVFDNIDRIL